jgi:hypothetical protein
VQPCGDGFWIIRFKTYHDDRLRCIFQKGREHDKFKAFLLGGYLLNREEAGGVCPLACGWGFAF